MFSNQKYAAAEVLKQGFRNTDNLGGGSLNLRLPQHTTFSAAEVLKQGFRNTPKCAAEIPLYYVEREMGVHGPISPPVVEKQNAPQPHRDGEVANG